uniref:Uncharacterized protein n=1 Tax=Glossina brevipalpis TaxID=37001 RepID=A0A1A9WYR7_9MUSC
MEKICSLLNKLICVVVVFDLICLGSVIDLHFIKHYSRTLYHNVTKYVLKSNVKSLLQSKSGTRVRTISRSSYDYLTQQFLGSIKLFKQKI